MTLKEFADITIKVILEDGVTEYLPTFVFPDTREIRTIQGIPPHVDHREAIQNVVRKSGYDNREFFFGVRSSPERITVGHHRPAFAPLFMEVAESADGYSASAVGTCEWWNIS